MSKSLKPGNEVEPSPSRRVPLSYRPTGSSEHHVRTGENWGSVAARYGIGAKKLIFYNFKTNVPEEVNWYLHHYVNCDKPTLDGFNWTFSDTSHLGASPRAGIIYIPPDVFVFDDPDPIIGTAPRWQNVEFWFSGTIADIAVGVIFDGSLVMRNVRGARSLHCWPLKLILAGRSLGWSGVTAFSTSAVTLRVDTPQFKPKSTWDGKLTSATYSGTSLAVTVHKAFKLRKGKSPPVKGMFGGISGDITFPFIIPPSAGGGAIGFYTMLGRKPLGRGGTCPKLTPIGGGGWA